MNKYILFLLLSFQSIYSNAQGLNNNYDIDPTDIKNTISLLGMEIYKFPIFTEDTTYLNVIIEEYRSDTLHDTYNHSKNLEGIPKQYIRDVSMISTPDTNWFRVYFYKKDVNTLIYRIKYNSLSIDFEMDDFEKMDEDTRAYDFTNVTSQQNQPVLIWYGSKPTGEWRHCPGGTPLETVVKKYDRVIAFKFELQNIE